MPVFKRAKSEQATFRFGLIMTLPLIAVMAACLWQVAAQEKQDKEKQDKKDEIGTIRIDTDLVSIDVIVTDSKGDRSSAGFSASDFVIYEDNVRQKIDRFSAAETPFNLVLLLDTSGSARAEIELIRRAARRFLDELRPQDRVAVIQFSREVELLKDLTSDRAKIENALELLKPGSGTSFYDSLKLTLDDVFKQVEGRKAIVALTDGVDSFGYTTFEQILPAIESSNILTYFLELDTEEFTLAGMLRDCIDDAHFKFSPKQLQKYHAEHGDKVVEIDHKSHCLLSRLERMEINRRLYESSRRELREMATQTGGRVYPVKSLQQLEPAYSQIAAELRTQYSMAYYPTNEKHDGKWRKLRVKLNRPGFVAKTRPGYRAPLD
ncbi:MAG TPA: VWA domain-containing protein [Blastocatellia bacterium]|nr:VWA domain-containing protein [Blastocatellia bacterium]